MQTRRIISTVVAAAVITIVAAAGYYVSPLNASGAQPGTLDDGKDLLPKAGISLDAAIAAAQAGRSGAIDEVDLEYWNGTLVFNVDVGSEDVKVDAGTGAVVDASTDD